MNSSIGEVEEDEDNAEDKKKWKLFNRIIQMI